MGGVGDPRYPEVSVPLSELNGNVYVLTGATSRALLRHGVDVATIETFRAEALSSDYDHALQTIMAWVDTT